jgi:hypothetical protein
VVVVVVVVRAFLAAGAEDADADALRAAGLVVAADAVEEVVVAAADADATMVGSTWYTVSRRFQLNCRFRVWYVVRGGGGGAMTYSRWHCRIIISSSASTFIIPLPRRNLVGNSTVPVKVKLPY